MFYFTLPSCIPQCYTIFSYLDALQSVHELDFFWHGAVHNLEDEKAVYELVHKHLMPSTTQHISAHVI